MTFYQNIGFKTYEKDDNLSVVFFDNQGSKLELYSLEELAKDINSETPPPLSQSGFGGITLACNMKSKKEVDGIMGIVKLHGNQVVKPPQEVFWGGYSGYFQDLDGYYWEVTSASSWKFAENDMLIIEDKN